VRSLREANADGGPAAAPPSPPERVAVLLATHNGAGLLGEQLDSILAQAGVDVDVWVSDDASSDGTLAYLQTRSAENARIHLMTPGRFGSAADNFLRLIRDAPLANYGFIAFADQDDVWEPFKLRTAIDQLIRFSAGGYSSDMIAFDEKTGREWLIRKSSPPTDLDYLFGGASAGCTYVLSTQAASTIQRVMLSQMTPARGWSHDWLFYAICRSNGFRWVFDPSHPIRYRQHAANQYGAKAGLAGVAFRIRNIVNGWYRARILDNGHFLQRRGLEGEVLARVRQLSLADRVWLAGRGWRMRRRLSHGIALSLAFLAMPRSSK
jgi:rhamnosyltransferase